ncbi:Glycoside hydrolase family 44 [Alteromonadaceae bacterium Bs31]|nr:Glycoside hydrolase family 44 [Alteromonadaceae bacterium Bs31]
MLNSHALIVFLFLSLTPTSVAAVNVSFSIYPDNQQLKISPLIYGTNQALTTEENIGLHRIGGNRLTAYNWENNWSNAGEDWHHSSDGYLIPDSANTNAPAASLTSVIDKQAAEAKSIVSLQMAGYVSADGKGPVSKTETAPSHRWIEVQAKKGAKFALKPNTSDKTVYMDELVNFMVHRYGKAANGGVFAYSLDNEPGLWSYTHPRIHPAKVGAAKLVARSAELAAAVKAVDPGAKTFGPALYGFGAYSNLQGAPDWASVAGPHKQFVGYYLAEMHKASQAAGKRLLDVLDLHYYSEAIGEVRITKTEATTEKDRAARLQAPRTLWDPDYTENSWIGKCCSKELPIIPKVLESIKLNYPGTELAFTEYNFGGEEHISGGLAHADALGIFGKYGIYAANIWVLSTKPGFHASAFRLFRNYDGAMSTFGDTTVAASMNDKENSSIYAAVNSSTENLHIIVLNKNMLQSLNGTFAITSAADYASGEAWALTGKSTDIQNAGKFFLSDNRFNYSLPALSAYHLVLSKQRSSTKITQAGSGGGGGGSALLLLMLCLALPFVHRSPFAGNSDKAGTHA